MCGRWGRGRRGRVRSVEISPEAVDLFIKVTYEVLPVSRWGQTDRQMRKRKCVWNSWNLLKTKASTQQEKWSTTTINNWTFIQLCVKTLGSGYNEFGYNVQPAVHMAPTYNEFSHNERPTVHWVEQTAITSSFLCIRIIDSNVKKFGYHEKFHVCFFTHCKWDSVFDWRTQNVAYLSQLINKQLKSQLKEKTGLRSWNIDLKFLSVNFKGIRPKIRGRNGKTLAEWRYDVAERLYDVP